MNLTWLGIFQSNACRIDFSKSNGLIPIHFNGITASFHMEEVERTRLQLLGGEGGSWRGARAEEWRDLWSSMVRGDVAAQRRSSTGATWRAAEEQHHRGEAESDKGAAQGEAESGRGAA